MTSHYFELQTGKNHAYYKVTVLALMFHFKGVFIDLLLG